MMAFNLCPDDGRPPRLWRFVAPGSLGHEGGRPVVSLLLKKENIQKIDRELLDTLSEVDRLRVLHTGEEFLVA